MKCGVSTETLQTCTYASSTPTYSRSLRHREGWENKQTQSDKSNRCDTVSEPQRKICLKWRKRHDILSDSEPSNRDASGIKSSPALPTKRCNMQDFGIKSLQPEASDDMSERERGGKPASMNKTVQHPLVVHEHFYLRSVRSQRSSSAVAAVYQWRQQLTWSRANCWCHQTVSFVFIVVTDRPRFLTTGLIFFIQSKHFELPSHKAHLGIWNRTESLDD